MRRDVRYTINPSGDKERHLELFKVPLGKLRVEVDRLHILANQGNTYALIRLESAQAILDRRMVVEEQVWKQHHPMKTAMVAKVRFTTITTYAFHRPPPHPRAQWRSLASVRRWRRCSLPCRAWQPCSSLGFVRSS